MQIRRVVTGHDSLGKAVFASDELVDGYHPMLNPDSAFHMLWGADEAPHFPDDGSKPTYISYFPTTGGFRFGTFPLPPADTVVQNGTRHAWHNRGEVPAHIAVFLVGAHHDKVG